MYRMEGESCVQTIFSVTSFRQSHIMWLYAEWQAQIVALSSCRTSLGRWNRRRHKNLHNYHRTVHLLQNCTVGPLGWTAAAGRSYCNLVGAWSLSVDGSHDCQMCWWTWKKEAIVKNLVLIYLRLKQSAWPRFSRAQASFYKCSFRANWITSLS